MQSILLPKCINNNTAVTLCINQACYFSNPFICKGCQNKKCSILHQDCKKQKWMNLYLQCLKTKNPMNKFYEELGLKIEETFHNLIQIVNKQYKQFTLWKQTFGIDFQMIRLLRDIQSNKQIEWTGQKITKLIQKKTQSVSSMNSQQIYMAIQNLKQYTRTIQKAGNSIIYNLFKCEQKKQVNHLNQIIRKEIKNQWKEVEELSPQVKKNIPKYKILFLGGEYVGKSSIINRIVYGQFDPEIHPTVGIDFISKNIQIQRKLIRLQFWDIVWRQRTRSLLPNYLKNTHIVFIIIDLTRQHTITQAQWFLEYLRSQIDNTTLIMVLGNKCDCKDQRIVKQRVIENRFRELGVEYLQVSAKNNYGLMEAIQIQMNILLATQK